MQILLSLSGGQRLSVHEISRVIDQSMESVWRTLTTLEQGRMVGQANGRFQLTNDGLAYLQRTGMRVAVKSVAPPTAPPAPNNGATAQGASRRPVAARIDYLAYLVPALVWLVCIPIAVATRPYGLLLLVVALAVTLLYARWSFRTVPEYQSLVVLRLGRCLGAKGPGLVLLVPFLDKPVMVDLRVKYLEVPHEQCITQDNVVIDVDFVLYWRVQQPEWSLTRVTNADESLRLLATALLRAVIAHFPFNEVQTQREEINVKLKEKIDAISTDWGVYVTTVEIREIKPPREIIESMQLQAAAEWQRQATVTEAEGYKEAAMKRAQGDAEALKMLYTVAAQIDDNTLKLKYFQTLSELGKSAATKYIFPLEMLDVIKPLMTRLIPGADGGQLPPPTQQAPPPPLQPNPPPQPQDQRG
jgi:regulator of protease activity HflC (stomatin/prohibitin superfamily)